MLEIGAITFFAVHSWLSTRRVEKDAHRHIDNLSDLFTKLRAKREATAPAAGPFRTIPLGEPGESPLPEPAPAALKLVYAWDAALSCPLCNANNRMRTIGKNRDGTDKDVVNRDTHVGCAGCDADDEPHLHVTCWACKFRYAMKRKVDGERK
jgi:hypothetical protein